LSIQGTGKRYRRRRWPFRLLLALGALAGVASWAYSPSLPRETLTARYANDKSKFIDIGGVRAHVRDQGNPDGIPLVLIHGAGGSLHVWEGWVGELGSKARLISVDLPGHELTGAWPRDVYTVEAYADFIEALVDALHLDRFVLAGHSLGACRRRLPLSGRHQGREARDFRKAWPRSDGGGREGHCGVRCRLPGTDPRPAHLTRAARGSSDRSSLGFALGGRAGFRLPS